MKLYSNLLRAAALAATIATSAMTHATTFSTNYTDMWGNAQESGWGLFIDQQADVLLGTLFIYDKFGIAAWYTVPGTWIAWCRPACASRQKRCIGLSMRSALPPQRA